MLSVSCTEIKWATVFLACILLACKGTRLYWKHRSSRVMYLMLCKPLHLCFVKHIDITHVSLRVLAQLQVSRGILAFPGTCSVNCSSGDGSMCVWEHFPPYSSDWQKQENRSFLYSRCLSISIFTTWVLSKVMKRKKSLFPESAFTYLQFELGVAISLYWLHWNLRNQSPFHNLVQWQMLSSPFVTWNWTTNCVLLAWFDLWSSRRAKICQDEWKQE